MHSIILITHGILHVTPLTHAVSCHACRRQQTLLLTGTPLQVRQLHRPAVRACTAGSAEQVGSLQLYNLPAVTDSHVPCPMPHAPQNNLHELYALLSYLFPDVFTSSEPFDSAFDLRSKEHKASAGWD